MKPMKKIPYEVEIDIYHVPMRYCRYYQEQIYDYDDHGMAIFEWEHHSQLYRIGESEKLEEICAPCPLNILLDVEGCRGELFGYEVFLKVIQNVRPDSVLLSKNVLDSDFNIDETKQILQEMEYLQEVTRNISWPVAQIFVDGKPVKSEESIQFGGHVYYEWTGDDEAVFFSSNDGFHLGLTNQGMVLRKSFGEELPEPFSSLQRKGMRVIGTTTSGKTVPIPINKACLPEWWPENNDVDSELRFTSLPVSDIYFDVFNMIMEYGRVAIKHATGIKIFSRYYRSMM
jgi:hypothetical protein